MHQVRRSLKSLPEDLKFSEIYHAVEKAYGKDSGRQCKVALYGVLKSSDEDVINKIKEVIEHVGEKVRLLQQNMMRVSYQHLVLHYYHEYVLHILERSFLDFEGVICRLYVFQMRPDIGKSVFHLAWAPESVPTDDVSCIVIKMFTCCLLIVH